MSEHYGILLDEASVTLGDLGLTTLISRVNCWDRYPTTNDEDLYLRLKNATIVVINKVSLNISLIESLPRLKLVLLTGTGTHRVDLDVCRERGIAVCNVTDYGNVVLAEALRSGETKGAGIDELEKELPPVDHSLLQAGASNVIVTPHIAWASA